MGKIRQLFSNLKYWFSELSGVFQLLIVCLVLSVASLVLSGYFGKTYKKFYPNEYESSVAVREYNRICNDYKASEEDEYGVEYSQFYDKRKDAVNSFMLLVRSLDKQYANGKFRHCYISGKEKIYQCYNKDKELIAVRLSRHTGGFWLGWGGGFEEMKPVYEIQFYIEK